MDAVTRSVVVAAMDATNYVAGARQVEQANKGIAGSSEQVGAAQQRTETTTARGTRTFERLRSELDRAYAAQQRFERAQAAINRAQERGTVSTTEAARLIELARERYLGLAAANDNAAGSVFELASSLTGGLIPAQASAALGVTAFVGALAGMFTASLRAAEQFERLGLRTEAVVRATGGSAGLTAAQIREFSQELARGTLASAEGVEAAAQKLLTFRSISGETFTRTLRAAQDLAAVGFGSLDSAATQLGKALENPRQGISALTEVGVTFTATQRRMIEAMQDAGNMAEAQRVILAAVESQVGGAGAAEAGGLAGAYDTLSQNVQEFLTRIGNQGPIQAATAAVNLLAEAVAGLDRALFRTNRYTPAAITSRLTSLRDELADLDAQLDGPAPQRGAGPGLSRLQLDQASARAAFVREEIARLQGVIDRADAERTATERQGAATRAQIERDGAEAALQALRESADRRLGIERQYQQQLATLRRASAAGVLSDADLASETAAAQARRDEALAALNRSSRGGAGGQRASAARVSGPLADSDTRSREATASLQNEIALLDAQGRLLTASVELRERELAALRARQQIVARNGDPESDASRAYIEAAQAAASARIEQQRMASGLQEVQRIGEQAFNRIGEAITQAFLSGEGAAVNWGNIAKAVISEVAQALVRLAIINPVMNAVFGTSQSTLGSVLSALGGAAGGAASGVNANWASSAGAVGPWLAFADGGVVTRPTVFGMANGTGVMGEAGPEAILPLRRGADGKLGVAAAGGGAAINQTINVNVSGGGGPGMGGNVSPDQARIIAAEVQKAARAAAEDAIRTNMRLGGMLNPSSGRAA